MSHVRDGQELQPPSSYDKQINYHAINLVFPPWGLSRLYFNAPGGSPVGLHPTHIHPINSLYRLSVFIKQ